MITNVCDIKVKILDREEHWGFRYLLLSDPVMRIFSRLNIEINAIWAALINKENGSKATTAAARKEKKLWQMVSSRTTATIESTAATIDSTADRL